MNRHINRHIDRKILLFIVFLLLGTIMSVQGRTIFEMNEQKTSVAKKIEQYKIALDEEQVKSEKYKKLINENEKKKETYLKIFANRGKSKWDDDIAHLGEELAIVKLKAGLTDVQGKGITINLEDAPEVEIDNPNLLLIHDSDVYGVINELKKAGAQAIAMNGERIIATSEQVCAGPSIKINKSRYSVPFEITAIGDPEKLSSRA